MTATVTTAAHIAEQVDADLGHFAAELAIEIPAAHRPQAQGDLYIIPAEGQIPAATRPLPVGGETVLAGRGGNAHVLGGRVFWEPTPGRQTLGTLTVPPGEVGYLFHAPQAGARQFKEHAPNAVGPGTYVIRRQRTQMDEIRMVQD